MALLLSMPAAAQPDADGATDLQAFRFTSLRDFIELRPDVYLDISAAADASPKALWDPVSHERLSSDQIDLTKQQRPAPAGDSDGIELADGGRIRQVIESMGARCGFTVGVSYVYQPAPEAAPGSFYVITRYSPPLKTSYCATPLQQEYDATLVYFIGLRDSRLLLVDWLKKLAVTFRQPPASIVDIGGTLLLVPGTLLTDALKAAGTDQTARYQALVAVIKSHPATPVQPQLVSATDISVPPAPAQSGAGSAAAAPEMPKPGFDCGKAHSRVEHLICDSAALAKADAQMSALYRRRLAADPDGAAALKSSQRAFLARRERCPDADCVQQMLEARSRELSPP